MSTTPISNPDARAISATVSPGRMWPRFEFFDKGHRVGGRCGVAVPVDGDHGVVPGLSPKDADILAMPLRIARAEV